MLVSKGDWDAIVETDYLLRSPAMRGTSWKALPSGGPGRRPHATWNQTRETQVDRSCVERINALIADIKRDPDGCGIGKPELLRNNLALTKSTASSTRSSRTKSRPSPAASTTNDLIRSQNDSHPARRSRVAAACRSVYATSDEAGGPDARHISASTTQESFAPQSAASQD